MYWGYHYWGMHLFWWIFWIVLFVVILTTGWPRSRGIPPDDAIDTLRNRYASGEIDEIEYHQRLAVLRGAKPPVVTSPPSSDQRTGERTGEPR